MKQGAKLFSSYPKTTQELLYSMSISNSSSLPELRTASPFLYTSNGLAVKALDSQPRSPVFKTTWGLQGRLNLSSFRGR